MPFGVAMSVGVPITYIRPLWSIFAVSVFRKLAGQLDQMKGAILDLGLATRPRFRNTVLA